MTRSPANSNIFNKLILLVLIIAVSHCANEVKNAEVSGYW